MDALKKKEMIGLGDRPKAFAFLRLNNFEKNKNLSMKIFDLFLEIWWSRYSKTEKVSFFLLFFVSFNQESFW